MADHRVSEISASRPRLRRDLRTHYQAYRGQHAYVIEDTSRGRFYQVGLPEYRFIQCFDGNTSFSAALARNAATQGEQALTEAQGDQMLRWLVDNDLLESASSGQGHRRLEHHAEKEAKRPRNQLTKLFFYRIPLGCPDRFMSGATRGFGWIFGWPGFLAWAALVVYTLTKAAPHWDRFVDGAGQVFAGGAWVLMAGAYVLLKVVHESGHGIATKRYGGAVPEWGVQLLAFVTPLAYVDASASTRFPLKWQRILVSSAGMYVESAVACLCLLAWLATGPGLLNTTLHGAVLAATVVTVLFNLNPLMRFDGYYILSDLIGIPNLGGKGQQWLQWVGKHHLLGMRDLPRPAAARLHPVAVPLYGTLAAVWKGIVWIGITIFISVLFKGVGLFLALLSLAVAVGGSLWKFGRFLFDRGKGPNLPRALTRLAALILVLGALLGFIRINPTAKALAVVEYEDEDTLRAGMMALVTAVHVAEGDQVEEGDLLVELSNPDEEAARDQLVLELAEARVRARRHYQTNELAAYQAELEVIRGLEQKLEESNRYLAAARVIAPRSGRVVARHLPSLPGRWVRTGDEILSLVGSDKMELLLSIRQEDIGEVVELIDREIRLRLRGRPGEAIGKLERIESRATPAVPHPALAASHGGPLALKVRPEAAGSEGGVRRENELARSPGGNLRDAGHFSGLEAPESMEELASPRFIARATLINEEDLPDWHAGEWGYVKFGGVGSECLGEWIYRGLLRYGRQKLENARRAT